jgi:opacity protein-like surface antigen
MKKIILSVVAIMAFGFANAQDKKEGGAGLAKGDLYLTGAFGFSSESTGDVKGNEFRIAPGAGFLISDNIAIEGQIRYESGSDTDAADVETKTNGIGIAAGAKYFFTPANAFSVSLGANISYMSSKSEENEFDTSFTTKEIGFNVPLGLHYFVSNNFAITSTWGGLGYSSNDNGGDGADKTNGLSLGLNMESISFGLIYKL